LIPVAKPLLPSLNDVAPWLQRVDNNRVYTNYGPLYQELKDVYAKFLGIKSSQIAILSSATLALEAVLRINKIERWIVPDFTFVATALAVNNAKKQLELVDVDEDDWRISHRILESRRLNSSSVGILPVIPFGDDLKLEKYKDFKHVVIDAAASLGCAKMNFDNLPLTWSIVFSLHATKVFPAVEGGLVVCGNSSVAQEIEKWAVFGFGHTRVSERSGTNAKLSEIHAAYGLASMTNREKEISDWRERRNLINSLSQKSDTRTFLYDLEGISPYWIANLGTQEAADSLKLQLLEVGVESRFWWPAPISQMPFFKGKFRDCDNYISRKLSQTLLGLPLHRDLDSKIIERIAKFL
jgi:dTDP-4-amino-4,6-dideoxygalactose transaminase